MSKSYPTDLTDEQWELLSVLIPPINLGCRPRRVDLRAVISAIFYVLCAGCPWRMLPNDFPKWQTVYYPSSVTFRNKQAVNTINYAEE
ncbi:transposase [Anabaenopsis elenkinii]|uniref:Transposase n=1 Tax=Anabaenopsis elenkinii CCIBt3563 TaxID=2779889 RepID=A0A7S6RE27_9CYAN|nr:transposase [Anabaenopsis elenkinii CCIBt3563]